MTSYFYCDFINDIENRVNSSIISTHGCLQYDDVPPTINYYVSIYPGIGGMRIKICLGTPAEFCRDFNDPAILEKYIKKAIRKFKKELTKILKEEEIL